MDKQITVTTLPGNQPVTIFAGKICGFGSSGMGSEEKNYVLYEGKRLYIAETYEQINELRK
ncbi:MAG TPA: hypothetical protein VK174_10655 [Chitinophagales bacterium]|nr:hypothetical protein [Chitinophagales bacterium]HLP50050.1 hypothetical protein [Chitinophagales bacterium]